MNKARHAMDPATANFMKNANTYLEGQNRKLKEEIAEGLAFEKLNQRVDKNILVNNAIDLGNWVRVADFRAQALRDPKMTHEAFKHFKAIGNKLEALKTTTEQKADLQAIDEVKAAMETFLANCQALQEVGKKRGVTTNEMLALAKGTALACKEHTTKIADEAWSTSPPPPR